jgi:2-keto-4-pentenoate hydratase
VSKTNWEKASDLIWQHWQAGTVMDDLPADLKPATRADGYAIQFYLDGRSHHPLVGWKIAATNVAGQAHIGVDGPLAGRILSERVYQPGAEISIAKNRMRVAEPEFCFRLSGDIAPKNTPYTVKEVLEHIDTLHLALEFPDSRFHDFATVGGPCLIADNACANDIIIGPAVEAPWRRIDLSAHEVIGDIKGRNHHEGSGADVLGDPRVALTWLVNEITGLGLTMRAKEYVSTGTSTVPLPITERDEITADFGILGTISALIAP